MLSSKYRFHSRGGVNYTLRHGHSLRSPLLSLVYAPNTRQKTRFAIVVSKKTMKSAVGRNRIRRRLYEAIRLALKSVKSPTDHIFIVHSRELLTLPFPDLQTTVKDLLSRPKPL